ncbi:HU family DNA-binding protein [Eubacterium ramulus]|uniref:HU family DNA-binding protein n=1 Tax=Eubacterium ramulus TaxID=39490 RepID=UPI00399BCFAA
MHDKTYYNQQFVINQIQNDTGCSARDVNKILSSLRNVVKDKLSDGENVELKLFRTKGNFKVYTI